MFETPKAPNQSPQPEQQEPVVLLPIINSASELKGVKNKKSHKKVFLFFRYRIDRTGIVIRLGRIFLVYLTVTTGCF